SVDQLPSPFLSTSSRNVTAFWPSLAIQTERLSQPAKRNGSDGWFALIFSDNQTAPPAVLGPSLSGWSSDVNHKFEFDCPGPSIPPLILRLFKNSFWAESSQPNTS